MESAIRNAFKLDGWDNLLSEIKKAEAGVKNCAERKNMNEIGKIFINVNNIKQEMSSLECAVSDGLSHVATTQREIDREGKVDTFLQLLYDNACFYEESKDRNVKRVTGTCDWFTDHGLFQKWNLPTESHLEKPRLLFVTADPGCGKSVLSRYLIDQILPDDGRTVCYFFFKDDFENQKSSTRAVCALLHQLFDSNRDLLTNYILKNQAARGKMFVQSFPELWKTFISVAIHQETVCILDALDECQDEDRTQLLDGIIGTRVSSLRFLLTSRPYDHIRREVSYRLENEISEIHLRGDSEETGNAIQTEIQHVVNSRTAAIAKAFRLKPDEHELMREQLNSVPNRTYLWITLVFDGLMKTKKSFITRKDIMDLTKSLPQDINDAYEKILTKTGDRGKAVRLLHLVLGAMRPLSLFEMSAALAFNGQSWDEDIIPEDRIEDTIRNLCGLFITVVGGRIYLLHQTAREFLDRDFAGKKVATSGKFLSSSKRDDAAVTVFPTNAWQHSFDLRDSHSILAETCISCLQLKSVTDDLDDMRRYSAIYWVDHYRQSAATCQEALANMTRDLCLGSEIRASWTEIYGQHYAIPASQSPLCLASALGLDRAVEMLLADIGEAEIDSKDEIYGQTPLSWAAEGGHEVVVRLLVDTGKADIDSKSKSGRTPLSWAAGRGHEAVVRLLVDTGKADIDSKSRSGRTPLLWAARGGHEAVVRLLVDMGKADIDLKDKLGRTPLSWAAGGGHEAVVRLLVDTGKANIDSKSSSSQTPLSYAAQGGYRGMVRLLESFSSS
jgi:ankyrin repeat protein